MVHLWKKHIAKLFPEKIRQEEQDDLKPFYTSLSSVESESRQTNNTNYM